MEDFLDLLVLKHLSGAKACLTAQVDARPNLEEEDFNTLNAFVLAAVVKRCQTILVQEINAELHFLGLIVQVLKVLLE